MSDGELQLAPLFPIAGFGGSLSEYIDALYDRYGAMLGAGIRLWGRPLVVRCSRARDGRDATFWHLVTHHTAEKTDQTRRLDLVRCAYLPRVCDVLERFSHEDPRTCWWRGHDHRILVAPVDFSMVVRLRKVRGEYLLETAWQTGGPHSRARTFERAAARWAVCEAWPAPRVTMPA